MPQIYSGNQSAQNFNNISNALVRRSHALEDDFTGDIDSEVRRVFTEIFKKIPEVYQSLAYVAGPDGYTFDALNRISEAKEIVPGSGDATQDTAADQPILSRNDNKQNLVTHSRLPGTLGTTEPDGWTSTAFGTTAPEGELVASDDGSDSHQAFEIPALADERRFLQNANDGVQGTRVIAAVRVEKNSYVSGYNRAIGFAGITRTTLDAHRLDVVVDGEWAWEAMQLDETTSYNLRFGLGGNGTVTSDGPHRISRPMLAYLPLQSEGGPDLTDNASVQTWLDNHYAASGTDHQEFAGFREMRVPYFQSQELSPAFQQGAVTEITWAVFANYLTDNTDGVRFFHSGANNPLLLIDTFGRLRFQAQDQSGSNVVAALGGTESANYFRVPILLTGTAKAGGNVKLYVNDSDEVVNGGAIPSIKDIDGNLRIGFSAHDRPWWMAWGFIFNKELTATEVATLNAIIRGE